MIPVSPYHLRRGIARTATRRLQHLPVLVHVPQAEVHQLHIIIMIKEYVLRFEVPVHHADLVYVLDARTYLLVVLARLLLLQTLRLPDLLEQLVTTAVLHD